MANYEVGKFYPLTPPIVDAITRQMGMGAIMMDGQPDLARGRRYDGANPDCWSFWTTKRQKIDVSVQLNGGSGDHFICGFGNGADPECPEPQFQAIANVANALSDLMTTLTTPSAKKCIKPDCENLVAPVGTKNPPPGVFKNYAQTGACQKGHNGYFCLDCKRPHSYASEIGKKHMTHLEDAAKGIAEKNLFDLITDIGFPLTAEALRQRDDGFPAEMD